MSNSLFAEAWRDISAIARNILVGDISPIEGARAIVRSAHMDDLEWDEDVIPFVAIDSETDALPFGEVRALWKPESLEKLQPAIDSAEAWAREIAIPHCLKLVERFG
jgi:hypothetical protein